MLLCQSQMLVFVLGIHARMVEIAETKAMISIVIV